MPKSSNPNAAIPLGDTSVNAPTQNHHQALRQPYLHWSYQYAGPPSVSYAHDNLLNAMELKLEELPE